MHLNALRSALALFCLLAPISALAAPPARSEISEPLNLSGTLSVQIADDFQRNRASTLYSVVVRPGYRVPLQFRGNAPANLRTGMKVRVSGRFDGVRLELDGTPGAFQVLDATATPTLAPATAHKALLILIDLVDGLGSTHAVSQTCDANDASAEMMFGSETGTNNVDGVYQESSFGDTGIGGAGYPGTGLDVIRVQVNDPFFNVSSTCNYDSWANSADSLAAAAGVNLGDFTHRVYILPPTSGCSWGGLGEVACGTDCRSWQSTYSFFACGTRGAYAHELGHNLGLLHASADFDNDGQIDEEYGDTSDFMGNNFDALQQNNAPHKLQLGWFDAARVVDGSAGGTFTLAATELVDPAQPQLVKLTPANGLPYYFSYRARIGYDASFPGNVGYHDGISIHRWGGGITNTRYVGFIREGWTFLDQGNAMLVSLLSFDATTATFRIVRNPVCTRAAPSLQLTPASRTVTAVPVDISYDVTLTNNDSEGCTNTIFEVRASTASGNASLLPGYSANVLPGRSAALSLRVQASPTVNGTYAVGVNTLADANHAAGSAAGNFILGVPCTYRAPSMVLSPSILSTNSLPHTWNVKLQVTNNDSGSNCPATAFNLSLYVDVGWTSTLSPASLTVPAGATLETDVSLTTPPDAANRMFSVIALSAADALHPEGRSDAGVVTIDVPPQACTRATPLSVLSPASQTATAVPASKAYTLTVSNKDSGSCPSTNFSFAGQFPAGWSASFSPTSAYIPPGASGTVTVNVAVPATAINGNYTIKAGTKGDANHPLTRGTANLVVSLGGGSCSVAAPTASLSPASQTTTTLPKALAYTLTVANKDSAACASTSFPLSVQVPPGWSGSVSPTNLSLAPGASGSATFTANAPTGAANATYAVKAGTAVAGSHAAVLASANAVVNVGSGGSDTTPPSTPGNLVAALAGTKVVLNWNASSDSGSGLANYKVYRNGAQWATVTSNTLSKLLGRGTWSFHVVAVDKAGNVSAQSNTVTITK